MKYKIQDIDKTFDGTVVKNLGDGEYVIKIDDIEHNLRILNMNSKGIEFILDQVYHKTKYLDRSTSEINLVVDNTPMSVNMHVNFDSIVYRNTGGTGSSAANAQTGLKSQIPGKVVSISVNEGDTVSTGDIVCTLESMKMQVAVKAHKAGVIKSLKIKDAMTVAKGDIIADID